MRGRTLATLLAALPALAAAHSADGVSRTAYLTLAPGELRLELAVTPGHGTGAELVASIDADGDETLTDPETRAWAERELARSELTLDGAPAAWTLEGVEVPPMGALAADAGSVVIHARASRPGSAGPRVLRYRGGDTPGASRWTANVFVAPEAKDSHAVTGQARGDGGRTLTVRYVVDRPGDGA